MAPGICNKNRQCRAALVRFNSEVKDFRVVVVIFDYDCIECRIANDFECFDAPAS